MSKLRLLFVKEAQASYISHLDLMRTFQRIFPRADLHLKHSQGYHPHPLISIVLPLPVAQSSECELLDCEVLEQTNGEGIAEKLNAGLPLGLRVRECYEVTRPARELAFLRAKLELEYDAGVPTGCVDALRELFSRESIVIEKRTKRKELAEIDIRPMISQVLLCEGDGCVHADVLVQAQNPGLNPALLVRAIETHLPQYAPDFSRVRREELFDEDMKTFR